MDDRALLRYSRHILLDEFGIEAQEKLLASRMLVIGAGGLGAAASMYLASAGVGHLTIADGDKVDLTNLQRQIVHREAGVGINKAESASAALRAINSDIAIVALPERLSDRLSELIAAADVVLDCTDNFATRHAINRACVEHAKPLVSGAAIRFD
ncbi:MAG: HesA/MoeB/ThiF family protein, partial [Betaproteobacteria bacterium]|nr:HesA/MoeB/ThiF family protein [Betaproteobacteria bacterium]